MGKSQEIPQLAVGRNGMPGYRGGSPHDGFFLGRTPQLAAGFFTRSNRMDPNRHTDMALIG
jgi:hypothetical protein